MIVVLLFSTFFSSIYNLYSNLSSTNQYKIEEDIIYIFIIILDIFFILECFLKIFAFGLVFKKNAYLTNIWDILDFINVIYCWLEIFKKDNVYLKFFRILRPLRIIKEINKNNKLLKSIKMSIMDIFNIIKFMFFFMLIFSIFGNVLYKDILYTRCRHMPTYDSLKNRWVSLPDQQDIELCNTEIEECRENMKCVNFSKIPQSFNLPNNFSISNFSYLDDNLQNEANLNYGITNFDSLFYGFLSLFIVMTFQSWGNLVDIYDEAVYPIINKIYFISVVIFFGFFLMKFVLAAENNALYNVFKESDTSKIKKEIDKIETLSDKDFDNSSRSQSQISSNFSDKIKLSVRHESVNKILSIRKFNFLDEKESLSDYRSPCNLFFPEKPYELIISYNDVEKLSNAEQELIEEQNFRNCVNHQSKIEIKNNFIDLKSRSSIDSPEKKGNISKNSISSSKSFIQIPIELHKQTSLVKKNADRNENFQEALNDK